MRLVGQSLTLHGGALARAVARRDPAAIVARARRQIERGADALDVNAGVDGDPGGLADGLAWAVAALRAAGVVPPLWLDATPEAIEAALPRCSGPLVVNAIPVGGALDAPGRRLAEAAARDGAGVVLSPRLVDAPPEAVTPYVEATARAAEAVAALGVTEVYLDALAYPVASMPEAARASLRRLEAYRETVPAAIPLAAVGNVTYGCEPGLAVALRAAYASLAVETGAGALILPVEDPGLVDLARRSAGEPLPEDARYKQARRRILEGPIVEE